MRVPQDAFLYPKQPSFLHRRGGCFVPDQAILTIWTFDKATMYADDLVERISYMPRRKATTVDGRVYSVAEVRAAILREQGLITAAADRLKCVPSTVYDYIKRYPEVKAAVEEARARTGDLAEGKLFQHLKDGQPWAVQFYLKTQGKDRGYVERQEVAGVEATPVAININRTPRRETLDEEVRIPTPPTDG
jgi:hypothetical protein